MSAYADCVFIGGKVYTADPALPWAEAVAVRAGKILAVGRTDELADLRGPKTELIALNGRLLLPGFTDSHIHFVELALRASQVDAAGAPTAGAVAELVAKRVAATPAGAWIRGGGWDAYLWGTDAPPHRALLDAVAPETPVVLDGKDLHSVWANSAALRQAGISAATADVPGGVIQRETNGEPTGILLENAIELIRRHYPEPTDAQIVAAVTAAIPDMWATGIVAIHNASDSVDGRSFRAYQTLHQRGELGLRVLQHTPVRNLPGLQAVGQQTGLGDAWLRFGGVKIFADGSLGSNTAHMLEPFLGQPDNFGVPTTEPDELRAQVLSASEGGLIAVIHAIGDRANRIALDALAIARQREASHPLRAQPLRHRIEHAQCLHPDDLPRFAKLGVIAGVQPIHAAGDMLMLDQRWGAERARGAYAFRSLLDSGACLVFGSDAPVEAHPPLIGIHTAVTRRRADGTPGPAGWQSQECITVAEAVDAYTCWPAYAAGEEHYRGAIAPGKVADLVVLETNIFESDPMAIHDTSVDLTMLDGQIVWQSGS